jgi:RimJ/RimL family protein N-acetyltransferase
MRLVLGQDALVAHWVALHIPQLAEHARANPNLLMFGSCAAIGVADAAGQLVGGVVYHNYSPITRNIELSFASTTPKWLTRSLIRALLSYPFDQLGCNRITGVTPRRATSARRFLDKFGFKREGVVRRGFGNDHAIISGLLRKEWEAHPIFRSGGGVSHG